MQEGGFKLTHLSEVLRGAPLSQDGSLVAQIYEILRSRIVSVDLLPGQRLSEKEISIALHASKTPVREALIRLEDNGLVEVVPKSGTYVTPIRIDRYVAACFVRLDLEKGAVGRAAALAERRHVAERLEAIIAEQRRALDADDYLAFFDLDQRLHRAFFELAGVGAVWAVIGRTQADVDRVRHLKRIHNIRRGPDVLREHVAIVEAIEAGRPDEAEAALVAHLGSLEAEIGGLKRHPTLLNFIETLNSRLPPRGGPARNGAEQEER